MNSLTTRNSVAMHVSTLGRWVSLHTGDPGDTGASEGSGSGYARAETTWDASATDGAVYGSEVLVGVAAGIYTHFGIWSDGVGGSFVGGDPIPDPMEFSGPGLVPVVPVITA